MEHHAPHIVPAAEIARRVGALQRRMRAEGPALLWVDHLADRLWLSGSAQDGVVLLPAEGEPRYFVRKSRSRAALESPFEAPPLPPSRGSPLRPRDRLPRRSRGHLDLEAIHRPLPAATP